MDLTKVIEPVLRPSRIKNAEKVDTIILDAGHPVGVLTRSDVLDFIAGSRARP